MKPTAHIPVKHPWVPVDLDGTLMEDNHYPGFGPPRPGARWAMERLHDLGCKVMVYTARTGMLGLDGYYQDVNRVVEDIYLWAQQHCIKIDYVFPLPKPTHVLGFIDDRAVPIVCPPDSNRDHEQHWQDTMNAFERRFGQKILTWRDEVTPKSYQVIG